MIDLSEGDNVQVLFTTHSSNLVREIPINSLKYIYRNANNDLVIENGINSDGSTINENTILNIVKTLGILPNPTDKVKILLFVEGNHDINALQRYSKLVNKIGRASCRERV